MTTNKHYYLVDDISETVLGSFFAKNERMAYKLVEAFDFKKVNLNPDDCSLYYDPVEVSSYETYLEIVESDRLHNDSDLLRQLMFDFEGGNDGL